MAYSLLLDLVEGIGLFFIGLDMGPSKNKPCILKKGQRPDILFSDVISSTVQQTPRGRIKNSCNSGAVTSCYRLDSARQWLSGLSELDSSNRAKLLFVSPSTFHLD